VFVEFFQFGIITNSVAMYILKHVPWWTCIWVCMSRSRIDGSFFTHMSSFHIAYLFEIVPIYTFTTRISVFLHSSQHLVGLSAFTQSGGWIVVSHCGFKLHFLDKLWSLVHLYMSSDHFQSAHFSIVSLCGFVDVY
jgi:hypothetical protein